MSSKSEHCPFVNDANLHVPSHAVTHESVLEGEREGDEEGEREGDEEGEREGDEEGEREGDEEGEREWEGERELGIRVESYTKPL